MHFIWRQVVPRLLIENPSLSRRYGHVVRVDEAQLQDAGVEGAQARAHRQAHAGPVVHAWKGTLVRECEEVRILTNDGLGVLGQRPNQYMHNLG